MPIDEKTAKYTIEFVWTKKKKKKSDDDISKDILQWQVSFKHNDEGGDIVTLKEGDNEAEIPAELFGEVTDLLRSKGFIPTKGLTVSTIALVDGQNVLPLPSVMNLSNADHQQISTEQVKPEYIEASEVVVGGFTKQSMTVKDKRVEPVTKKANSLDADVDELLKSIGESSVSQKRDITEDKRGNFKQFVPPTPDDMKEKAQRMRSQRMQAKKKAAEGGAKVVKRIVK